MSQSFTSLLTFRKGIFIGVLIFLATVNFGFAQNCNANLSVEKDRNVKSVYKDGTAFNMVLTNTSSKSATYVISTKNLKESCSNENKKTSAPNVTLNVEVRGSDSQKAANNSLTLKGGETRTFKIFVSIPSKTPYNTWSCIEVQVTSDVCPSPASTVISVFVPEPSEG